MIGRRLLALIVGGLILLPGPAFAEENYPAPSTDLNTNHGAVSSGGTVTISGVVGPNDRVTIRVRYPDGSVHVVGTTTADSLGRFSLALSLTQLGTATISAVGFPSGRTATTSVTVHKASAGGGLASTGRQLGPLVGTGAAALLIGFLLVGLAVMKRRRRSSAETE